MIKSEEKSAYFAAERTDIEGSGADPRRHIFRLENEGIMFRTAHFDTEKGGDPIEILHTTDLHLNCLDAVDCIERRPCILSTREFRLGYRDGSTVPNTVRTMALSKFFDQTVVTGDTLDYITHGTFDLTKRLVWDVCPDAFVTIGGHDITRVMQGKVPDDTTLESRYALLSENWRHDIHYVSRVLGDKVRVVAVNNGQSRFFSHQTERLRADISDARARGHIVLLFWHEPICTRNPNEVDVVPIRVNDGSGTRDFCHSFIGKDGQTCAESLEFYNLVTHNADVIRGIFCGHWHSDFYTEILAETPDGKKTVIPQYVLTGNMYDKGHALIITVD